MVRLVARIFEGYYTGPDQNALSLGLVDGGWPISVCSNVRHQRLVFSSKLCWWDLSGHDNLLGLLGVRRLGMAGGPYKRYNLEFFTKVAWPTGMSVQLMHMAASINL